MSGDDRVERVTLAAAPPAPSRVAGQDGRIVIGARPWAQIFVDGRPFGTTPKTMPLSPGAHTVTLVRGSHKVTKRVVVKAGGKTTVFHDFDANPF
ncbi:MAG: hypothetical protein CVU56_21225 [Deltaproteobacteria bacterium HGW-Deltaproteobacteria-14]|nr:MAG: hypothetical protein CVU56_21225 [Deltaproteobacteria bacterium HGW-Deltaproteobacteria-14]